MRDRRESRLKVLLTQPGDAQEAKERAQRGADGLHRPRREPSAHRGDKPDDVGAAEAPGIDRVVTQGRAYEQAHQLLVAAQGSLSQPAGPTLVLFVLLDHSVEGLWVRRHAPLLSRDDSPGRSIRTMRRADKRSAREALIEQPRREARRFDSA